MSRPLDGLKQDGFYMARGLLPRPAVAGVLESIHRTVLDQLRHLGTSPGGPTLHAALRTLLAVDVERYQQTLGALWRKADVSALMRHTALFDFLRETFGWRDVFLPGGEVVFVVAADLRIPGGYFGLGAHQDFPSVQGSLDGVVAWIPLTDVDRSSHTLEVVPGSHRRGLITAVEHTRNGWEIPQDQLPAAEWRPIEAAIGDVAFLSVFMIHRTAPLGDPQRLRIALSTRFDNAAEPTFIARGYPTAYQRQVKREQYLPDFPTAEQIGNLFG